MPVATRANSAHYGISDETLMVGGTRSNDLQNSHARGQAHTSISNEEMAQRLLAIREQHASNAYAAQQQRTRTASTCLDADCISPLFNVSTAAAQPNRPAPSTAPAPRTIPMYRDDEPNGLDADAETNALVFAALRAQLESAEERANNAEAALALASRPTRIKDEADDEPKPKIEPITPLNSTQLSNLTTALEPGKVNEWTMLSASALGKKTQRWAKLWREKQDMPEESFLKLLESDPILRAEDEHNSGMIMGMLDRTSVNVANFKSDIIKLDTIRLAEGKPLIVDSAWLLYSHIKENARCGEGMKRAARVKEFKVTSYFGSAMNNEQFIEAANRMINDFKLLPESERKDSYAIFRALLAKMPAWMVDKITEYEYKITKAETLGKKFKWSIDEFVQILSIDYEVASASELTGRAGKSFQGKDSDSNKCTVCNKSGHYAGERDSSGKLVCSAFCTNCKERNCPAALGASDKCILKMATMPSHGDYKNAGGKTVPKHIYEFLVQKHSKRSLNVKSASVGIGTEDKEDDAELACKSASAVTSAIQMF